MPGIKKQLPPYWTEEQIKIFFEFAGKVPDPILAEKMGANDQTVCKYRRRNSIPSCLKFAYTESQEKYIIDNYEKCFNWEMAEYLNKNLPAHRPIKPREIRTKLISMGLVRSPDSVAKLNERRNQRNSDPGLRKKSWDTRGRNPIGKPIILSGGRVKIKQEDGNYKFMLYKNYIWEQANGKTPKNKAVEIIDNSKPVTIENLRLRDYPEFELTDNRIVGYIPGLPKQMKEQLKLMPNFLMKERLKFELKKLAK